MTGVRGIVGDCGVGKQCVACRRRHRLPEMRDFFMVGIPGTWGAKKYFGSDRIQRKFCRKSKNPVTVIELSNSHATIIKITKAWYLTLS
ncbi:hypothetical protein [Nostoc sp.]|uniref:hypothetical protein n=1 Tax=Nostoc sp. TaxID=1180 RepID=UPI002FF91DCE